MKRRVISLWFPKLPSERVLRKHSVDGPFAIVAHIKNADRLVCLNAQAAKANLSVGMGLSDARSFCPDLRTVVHNPQADKVFLDRLTRWAKRYCPWVGQDGVDGLFLDITGSAHLFGGESAILNDIQLRLSKAQVTVRIGLANTKGAAWALARYGKGIADAGCSIEALSELPVAALRITDKEDTTLQRLGIRKVGQLADLPRATLGQRFGPSVLMRLDQALGNQSESISPHGDAPNYATRLTLPEPIGLSQDIMAGIERLLDRLCQKLMNHAVGARVLLLVCRRVDGADQQVELRLARALRDATRILPLFERGVNNVNSGFGIDQLRLVAIQVEDLPVTQITNTGSQHKDRLHDLTTRLGNRIGLENIQRFLPAESHIPERSFLIAPSAWSEPAGPWLSMEPRPLTLFPPEYIAANGTTLPSRFKWRRMSLTVGHCVGPERIAPEWWLDDENWHHGVRDYWRVATRQGRRLWMFYTPQNPSWYVQGEFA